MASGRPVIGPPVWSSSWYWKPPNTERPWMPGGANGITRAPGICIMGPRTRSSTAASEWLWPRRSS